MKLDRLFPTYFYQAHLSPGDFKALNSRIEKECRVLQDTDAGGIRWSRDNYFGGYTSYSSVSDLPSRSPTFEALRRNIDREVRKFVRVLEWDLTGGRLEMSTCWVNVMGRGCHHSSHLHPHSALSGTYFVRVPKDSGSFKIEDPRIAGFMGSPQTKASCRNENRRYVALAPKAGDIYLFESWLKHEVTANRAKAERISVSFNYDWI